MDINTSGMIKFEGKKKNINLLENQYALKSQIFVVKLLALSL